MTRDAGANLGTMHPDRPALGFPQSASVSEQARQLYREAWDISIRVLQTRAISVRLF
jgi:hypothetical protein